MQNIRWTVSQLGAREHYAVPRAFLRQDKLRQVYTDVWCRFEAPKIVRGPSFVRAFRSRRHAEISSALVTDFPLSFAFQKIRGLMRRKSGSISQLYTGLLQSSGNFDRLVRDSIRRQRYSPETDAFFGFAGASLRTLQHCSQAGILTILDQMDPGPYEEKLVAEEVQRWKGWQESDERIPEAYWDHIRSEWASASIVLVNSIWSRNALVQEGVPENKIVIIPLAYEAKCRVHKVPNLQRARPLKVLWLGSVCLRKGIQYLIEAARELRDRAIEIIVAGPVHVSRNALASAPHNVRFVGRVTRDRIEEWYSAADVFVLPTISDGFAITQLEALAHGLPVITTSHCGEVVSHGVDGLVVPARDSQSLASAIVRLDEDRTLLAEMSAAASLKPSRFSIDEYGRRAQEAINWHMLGKPLPTLALDRTTGVTQFPASAAI